MEKEFRRVRKCGLLGEKLGHSYSPEIHSMLGDYEYKLYECSRGQLSDFFGKSLQNRNLNEKMAAAAGDRTSDVKNAGRKSADFDVTLIGKGDEAGEGCESCESCENSESGGSGGYTDWDGLNVTIPYKHAVVQYCDELSEAAAEIGSVNTLVKRADGSIYGDNTDADGFMYLVESSGIDVKGRKVLVLGGTGGAGAAVCYGLKKLGAARIVVVSRTGPDNYENLAGRHGDGEVIVNATPVGMYPDNGTSPVDLRWFPNCSGVIDIVYNPARTALMLQAEALGLKGAGGLGMLVAQAAAAAELFGRTGESEGGGTEAGPARQEGPAELQQSDPARQESLGMLVAQAAAAAELFARTDGAEGGGTEAGPDRQEDPGMLVAQAAAAAELFVRTDESEAGPARPEGPAGARDPAELQQSGPARPAAPTAPRRALIRNITETISSHMQNIALIGMPGSGKTTIGRKLAEQMGRPFIDSDEQLEKLTGMTPAEILTTKGEPEFRRLETEILRKICCLSGHVIATGGGCVTISENYNILHQNSKIVWLQRPLEELPIAGRPISQKTDLSAMARQRYPLYKNFADYTVQNTGNPEDTIKILAADIF